MEDLDELSAVLMTLQQFRLVKDQVSQHSILEGAHEFPSLAKELVRVECCLGGRLLSLGVWFLVG